MEAVTATAALTLWAFLGLESATVPADNVNNPSQTIPRATMIGFVVVAAVYISSTLTIMSVVPNGKPEMVAAKDKSNMTRYP